MRSSVGSEWSAEAARSYLSFLSVASQEEKPSANIVIVLAAPCHPSQIHGLTLLADAGLLSFVVLLEKRKPKAWGVFDRRDSGTGVYLSDIGLTDCGWLEWDSSSKAEAKLEQILEEVEDNPPCYFVACCRDAEASDEHESLISESHAMPSFSLLSFAEPQLQTVFGKFLRTVRSMVPTESIFWVPPQLDDLEEFRRRLALFRKIQQGTPGRPTLVLNSSALPTVYADIRSWCEGSDRDNPIFLIYQSGLPQQGRSGAGGLTDGLLLLSIPGLNVAVPADEEEAKTLFEEADSLTGPTALMFCQSPAVGLSSPSSATPGKGRILREGKDLALVAIGSTVFPSLLAAESLQAVGLSVAVYDLRYRRPLDTHLIDGLHRFALIVAVDEHPQAGGISSHLWRPDDVPCKLVRVGIEVEDVLESAIRNPKDDLTLEHFGLHAEGIARTVRECLKLAPPTAFG